MKLCFVVSHRVAKKSIDIEGNRLKIYLVKNTCKEDICAIFIQNVQSQMTETVLTLFFENKRASGGGPIEGIFVDEKTNTAVITFESIRGMIIYYSIIYDLRYRPATYVTCLSKSNLFHMCL